MHERVAAEARANDEDMEAGEEVDNWGRDFFRRWGWLGVGGDGWGGRAHERMHH